MADDEQIHKISKAVEAQTDNIIQQPGRVTQMFAGITQTLLLAQQSVRTTRPYALLIEPPEPPKQP
jgi:hypothetical protein